MRAEIEKRVRAEAETYIKLMKAEGFSRSYIEKKIRQVVDKRMAEIKKTDSGSWLDSEPK